MTGFYLYLLKAILSLGIVYGIYLLCLQKLTFFQWNRWYLLLYSCLAFIVPFININKVASVPFTTSPDSVLQQIPSIYQWVPINNNSLPETNTVHQSAASWTYEHLLLTGMLLVSILLTIRLAISILSLLKITRDAELLGYVNQCKIIRVPKPLSPFSFSNTIVIGNQTYATDELEKILTHEMIHTRQRHSVDMVFAELLIVLAWWNPFSWLVRKSIRQNLEFIADREVIKQGVEVHPYQMLLLKTMQKPALCITNAFSFSHIKKRIMMMNIKTSHRLQLARFLLIAPAFAVLVLLFRSPVTNAQETASQIKLSTSKLENSSIFAEINKDAEGMVQSDTVYFGGVVIHEETGKPVAKFPISISLNDKTLTTLLTDQSGKYFYATPIPQTGKMSAFSWKFLHTEFAAGESGFSIIDSVTQPNFYVHLVAPKKTKRRSVSEPVQISHNQIRDLDFNSIAILNNIAEKSKSIFDKHKELLAMEKDFISKTDTANKTFVLYNGWLYWKRMENESWTRLEKPENLILKLADDTVTYEDVNKWFANHKRYIISQTPAYKNKGSLLSIEFYTDPFSVPKPSKALLVNGKYQTSTILNFREDFSKEDAVYINGFRAYRNSQLARYSDLLSGNENAKTIYKLTGALAAHYSEKASVVWWIETRVVKDVFNRPDFSGNKNDNLTPTEKKNIKDVTDTVVTAKIKLDEFEYYLESDAIELHMSATTKGYLKWENTFYPLNTVSTIDGIVNLPDGKSARIFKLKIHHAPYSQKKFGEFGKDGVYEVISGKFISHGYSGQDKSGPATGGALFEHGKLHVMYAGVHNPIKVHVPGYTLQDLSASFSHGNVSIDDNMLVVTPTQASNDAMLKLYNKKNELVASRVYKVKSLPNPIISK